jgi:cobalt-zinc-cadmium efflux system protein
MGGGHSHSHELEIDNSQTARRLILSLVLTLVFVFFEAGAGVLANSLALLTDAAHNITDVIALALSLYAVRMAARPASASRTFGYHRVGILVALLNSTTLVLISLGIFYEAYQRLLNPPEVQATIMIVVAVVAFGVNLGTALLVRHGSESDLNMRSAFVHLAGDALSTLGAIVAGVLIALTGLQALDALASILIGVLILYNAWGIVRETVDILLENTPRDVDMEQVVRDLLAVPGVRGVHDLHVWSITRSMRALSAHVVTADVTLSEGAGIQMQINELLRHDYDIAHATIQLEASGCDPDELYCDLVRANGHDHD